MPEDLERRARGCFLGVLIGDALGAGVEGWPADKIERLALDRWQSPFVQDVFPAVHMATPVLAGGPGQYREAMWMEDVGLRAVPVGPPSNVRGRLLHGRHADQPRTRRTAGSTRMPRRVNTANSFVPPRRFAAAHHPRRR